MYTVYTLPVFWPTPGFRSMNWPKFYGRTVFADRQSIGFLDEPYHLGLSPISNAQYLQSRMTAPGKNILRTSVLNG
jgi:hypothetical protein